MNPMPRDGSLTPADLIGKMGADAKLTDWLARMTARSGIASICQTGAPPSARFNQA
jgi:hypothetical protein